MKKNNLSKIVVYVVFALIVLAFFGYSFFNKVTDEVVIDEVVPDEVVLKEPSVEGVEVVEEDEVVADEVAEKEVFKAVAIGEQDPEVKLIKEYYSHFWVDELDEAYAMKYEPNVSFDTFVGWYENTLWATPYEFVKTGENRYKFMVDLMEEGGNNERYNVVMEVHGEKLKTISSTKINDEITEVELVYDSALKAYVNWEDGDEEVHLVKNGVDVLIDSIERPDYGEAFTALGDLEFSDSGRFFMYYKRGWEGGVLKVYDVLLNKESFKSFTPYEYGFTVDEKYFYECQGTGMHGGFLNVWVLPNFEFKRNLVDSFTNAEYGVDTCSYDSSSNVLEFSAWAFNYDQGIEHFVYDFGTDKVY